MEMNGVFASENVIGIQINTLLPIIYQYIKGDTILNGIPYKKLYEECTTCTAEGNEYINQTVAFMREVNG